MEEQPPPELPYRAHLLEPVSGATLYRLEKTQRTARGQKGKETVVYRTGCGELDDEVLCVGGFEGGSVVGVSTEEGEFGLVMGLQTVAGRLMSDSQAKVSVITTLPPTTLLPMLRRVVSSEVSVGLGRNNNNQPDILSQVRSCLERILISQVFDIEGVWETLSELETTTTEEEEEEKVKREGEEAAAEPVPEPEPARFDQEPTQRQTETDPPPPAFPPDGNSSSSREIVGKSTDIKDKTMEISDSEEDEDEEPLSLASNSGSKSPTVAGDDDDNTDAEGVRKPDSPTEEEEKEKDNNNKTLVDNHHPPLPPPPQLPHSSSSSSSVAPTPQSKPKPKKPNLPSLILLTHFSSHLSHLMSQTDRPQAHSKLQLLSTHLRHLARSEGLLVMLLNSVTTSTSTTRYSDHQGGGGGGGGARNNNNNNNNNDNPDQHQHQHQQNPPPADQQTLRSIFSNHTMKTKKMKKPSFGPQFAQFLDLHLLCTQVPRSRSIEVVDDSTTCWVVEVLLDERGCFVEEEEEAGKDKEETATKTEARRRRRKNREQRWGAVDLVLLPPPPAAAARRIRGDVGVGGGMRVVDASF